MARLEKGRGAAGAGAGVVKVKVFWEGFDASLLLLLIFSLIKLKLGCCGRLLLLLFEEEVAEPWMLALRGESGEGILGRNSRCWRWWE